MTHFFVQIENDPKEILSERKFQLSVKNWHIFNFKCAVFNLIELKCIRMSVSLKKVYVYGY